MCKMLISSLETLIVMELLVNPFVMRSKIIFLVSVTFTEGGALTWKVQLYLYTTSNTHKHFRSLTIEHSDLHNSAAH